MLTGPSGTGKSTIAKALVEADPRWQIIKERALLHELAVFAGEKHVRDWWKKAGTNHLVQCARKKTLVILQQMLEKGVSVVIDGCYDPWLKQGIVEAFPGANCLTVLIHASVDRRQSNMQRRLSCSLDVAIAEMRLIDRFKTEAGMAEVVSLADIEIANNGTFFHASEALMRFLRSRGCEIG